jgi:hypothetical protein
MNDWAERNIGSFDKEPQRVREQKK